MSEARGPGQIGPQRTGVAAGRRPYQAPAIAEEATIESLRLACTNQAAGQPYNCVRGAASGTFSFGNG